MKIIRTKNYEELSKEAAKVIAAQINEKPDSVLGLATGGSPVGTYAELVEMYNQGKVDFEKITSINLDEYRGMKKEQEQSYWKFMQDHLFSHVNIKPENTHVPEGENLNIEEVCKNHDAIIEQSGGIDLQLLGIGVDGHIGFNEPADCFELGTHCIDLEESTIEANKRYFNSKDEVPRQAYTMGIRPIMQAKKVLMVADGKAKAHAIATAFTGKVTPQIPASILLLHPDFTLIADEAALSELPENFFEEV